MLTSIVERRTSLPGDHGLEILVWIMAFLEVCSVAIGDRALQLSLALLEALPVAAATLDVSEPPRDAQRCCSVRQGDEFAAP
jgi:hypothetical protein